MRDRSSNGRFCVLLAIFSTAVFLFGSAGAATMSGSPAPLLAITGASYAADWKQPALPGYRVVNRGVAGEQTHQVLARFHEDVISAKPAVVLIWGHINNVHRAPPGGMAGVREAVKADYQEMVRRSRAAGIEVWLATEVTLSEAVGLTNRAVAFINRLRGRTSYNATVNTEVRALNDWLRGYARQEGIRLLDFEQALDDGRGFRKLDYSSDDGSHVSAAGYVQLTKYTVAQLARR